MQRVQRTARDVEQLISLLPPVSITMLMSSIIIVNVRSDSIDSLLSQSLSTYAVSNYLPVSSNSSSSGGSDDRRGAGPGGEIPWVHQEPHRRR